MTWWVWGGVCGSPCFAIRRARESERDRGRAGARRRGRARETTSPPHAHTLLRDCRVVAGAVRGGHRKGRAARARHRPPPAHTPPLFSSPLPLSERTPRSPSSSGAPPLYAAATMGATTSSMRLRASSVSSASASAFDSSHSSASLTAAAALSLSFLSSFLPSLSSSCALMPYAYDSNLLRASTFSFTFLSASENSSASCTMRSISS